MAAEHAKTTMHDKGTAHERVRYEHDAFGVVKISKSQGSNMAMFGSALAHGHCINLEVSRAYMDRRGSRDWVYSDEDIVRLRMSTTQWAELISSGGSGTGTQVTLEYAPARGTRLARMPELLQDPVRDTFESEIRASAKDASDGVIAAQEKIDAFLKPGAKPPTKKDLEALRDLLREAGAHFQSNMAHVQRNFTEAMEATVASAKTEIEAFVTHLAMSSGIEALRNGVAPTLIDDATTKPVVDQA